MLHSRVFSGLLLVGAVVSCKDPKSPMVNKPLGDVVVLNGVDPTGVTILAEPGGEPTHLSFDPFDGASFALRNDTVASTSSKGSGDLLFVADLNSRVVNEIQLPAASNPAGVQFAPSTGLGTTTRLYVALRDAGRVAEVPLPSGSGPIVLHEKAGVCPVDVVATPDKVWALDSNQRCASDYATLGPSRLVPLPGKGSVDTISLSIAVVGAQRAFVVGNHAYVMSSGDYAAMQGALTKVDLSTRNIIVVTLPADHYGISLRIGENGYAYVTAAPPFAVPAPPPKVYAIHLETMTFGGTRMPLAQHLRLMKRDGKEAVCFAATADVAGNVYCVENGNILSNVIVFNTAGNEVRRAAAGSLAFDIALR